MMHDPLDPVGRPDGRGRRAQPFARSDVRSSGEQAMTTDRLEALHALLAQTEQAHGVFETTELHGVYDAAWPAWYAAYAVEHGIDVVVGHPVTTDELERFLAGTWAEFQRLDPKPADAWVAWTARRIAAEL
jgi:hypothetical protein